MLTTWSRFSTPRADTSTRLPCGEKLPHAHKPRRPTYPCQGCSKRAQLSVSKRTHPSEFKMDNSSSVSSMSAAAAESVTDEGRFAPGIGMTQGDWASSHASAIC